MTYRKTYRLYEDEVKELVYEDILDENGQILSFKDHQSPFQAEGFSKYNANGLLVCESDVIGGEEGSRTEYIYNSKDDIINRKIFLAGELFEELSYEYFENGFTKRTFQHGEEIERFIEIKNREKFLREFFEGAELIERHEGMYDPETRTELIRITDNAGKLLATRFQEFDESANVLKYEEKNENGNLLILSYYKYENNKVVFEKYNNYSNDQHYEAVYEYDFFGNMTSKEVRTPSGKLIEYQIISYDDRGRIIAENGYSVGSFDAIYGTYVHGEKYSFEHTYEVKLTMTNR